MPSIRCPYLQQSAVVPVRRNRGRLEVLLVTSGKGRRWVIPKGMKDIPLSPRESAAKEALEEAGIEGRVSGESIGTYTYMKSGKLCKVQVFIMVVEVVHDQWLEDHRERRWLPPGEAARKVNEKGLKRMLRHLPQLLTPD